MSELEIPDGYSIKKLSDLCSIDNGHAFKSNDYQNSGIPLIRISNIQDDMIQIDKNIVFVNMGNLKTHKDFLIKKNDMLIALSGATTGKCGIYYQDGPAMLNQRVGRLRLNVFEENVQKYLFYFLKKIRQDILSKSYGGAQPNISLKTIGNFEILFPNDKLLPKITQKIDRIFNQFEENQKKIISLQKNIKNKNAVNSFENYFLEKIIFGDSTQNWRKNNCNINSGTVILEKIRKNHSKKILSSLRPVSLKIPKTWTVCFMGDVFEIKGGMQKTPKRKPVKNYYPYLRVGNVYKNRLDLDRVEHFEITDGELEQLRLKSNDLLIVEGNGSIDQIGRSAIWNNEIPNCIHQNHIIRCRPLEGINSTFLSYYLTSLTGRKLLEEIAITTSGLHTLSIGKLSRITIPLPPIEEQDEIVYRVKKQMEYLELIKKKTSIIENNKEIMTKKIHDIYQSILAKIFSGEIVI